MTSPELPPPSDTGAAQALAEATPDSLSELFSRDPEHYTRQDLDRVIHELRLQRERCKKAEEEGGAAGKKPRRVTSGEVPGITNVPANPEDLGL